MNRFPYIAMVNGKEKTICSIGEEDYHSKSAYLRKRDEFPDALPSEECLVASDLCEDSGFLEAARRLKTGQIFAVVGFSGSYSDHHWWMVKAFFDRKEAENYRAGLQEWVKTTQKFINERGEDAKTQYFYTPLDPEVKMDSRDYSYDDQVRYTVIPLRVE